MKLDVEKASGNGNGHEPARVDLETGELTCPRCQELKVGDIELYEKQNLKLQRRVDALERDVIENRLRNRERKKVIAVIEHWKQLTGHPKANAQAADRFDIVVQRRAELYPFGDPVEDPPEDAPCPTICLAIEGLAAYPYANKTRGRHQDGKKCDRYDRLGIALASGEKLEEFARRGWLARQQNGHHAT